VKTAIRYVVMKKRRPAPEAAFFALVEASIQDAPEPAPVGLWGRYAVAFDRAYASAAAWLGFQEAGG